MGQWQTVPGSLCQGPWPINQSLSIQMSQHTAELMARHLMSSHAAGEKNNNFQVRYHCSFSLVKFYMQLKVKAMLEALISLIE